MRPHPSIWALCASLLIATACLVVLGCSTTQPLAESTDAKSDSTTFTTNDDGIVARSYAGKGISAEELRIVHAGQVSRLTKGTAEKPIIDGKRAALKVVLNGAGSGSAPTSMTVDAPRSGTLKVLVVNNATSESTPLPDVSISKGVNEMSLNLGGLSNGAYTIRVSEGALVATVAFSVAR